jgi:hypothetical protein
LKDFGSVKAGELGGYVAGEHESISQRHPVYSAMAALLTKWLIIFRK